MSWHPFKKGEIYDKSYIVEICFRYIDSGKVADTDEKRRYVNEIESFLSSQLRFAPTTSWGASPMNPDAWETLEGESIRSDEKLSSKSTRFRNS